MKIVRADSKFDNFGAAISVPMIESAKIKVIAYSSWFMDYSLFDYEQTGNHEVHTTKKSGVEPHDLEDALNPFQFTHERFEMPRIMNVKPDVTLKDTIFRVNRYRTHVDV